MSPLQKLFFGSKRQRASVKGNAGRRSFRKMKKAGSSEKKVRFFPVGKKTSGRATLSKMVAGYYRTNAGRKRKKRNVSHIVVVRRRNPRGYKKGSFVKTGASKSTGKPIGYYKKNPRRRKNNPRKVIIVNMARRRRTNKARRHRNVVYRKRIKRGVYQYSSNPGRRRRRRHNPGVRVYRRRRHSVGRRHHYRRRNPGMFSGTAGKVLGVVGGLAVTKLLMGFVPASLNSGVLGYLTTGVVAVAQGKLIGKVAKNAALGEDMMVGGLAYLAAKVLNDFLPSIGGYTGISGMGLIGGSSFYVPQVQMGGNMGKFVTPSAVSGAIVAAAPAPSANTGVGRLRRTGRLM